MQSSILSHIGLGNIDPAILILMVIILLGVVIALIVIVNKQKKRVDELNERIDSLTRGRRGASLEEELIKIIDDNGFLITQGDDHEMKLRDLRKRARGAYQKMALLPYNAYSQLGGRLSFVLVMLDENNSGFLINTVHSSESCFSYAKEIANGTCNVALGAEEQEALAKAMSDGPTV